MRQGLTGLESSVIFAHVKTGAMTCGALIPGFSKVGCLTGCCNMRQGVSGSLWALQKLTCCCPKKSDSPGRGRQVKGIYVMSMCLSEASREGFNRMGCVFFSCLDICPTIVDAASAKRRNLLRNFSGRLLIQRNSGEITAYIRTHGSRMYCPSRTNRTFFFTARERPSRIMKLRC